MIVRPKFIDVNRLVKLEGVKGAIDLYKTLFLTFVITVYHILPHKPSDLSLEIALGGRWC